MNVTSEQLRWVLIRVFVLIVSVALHEFGHAFVADALGDDTPRRQGRVTLNPIAHADPVGTLLLPLLGGLYAAAGGGIGGFGWGKPVQWNPARVNRKWTMSTAKILVSIAGPSMNLLLGSVIMIVAAVLVGKHAIPLTGTAFKILYFAGVTNFVLFFFNLIPAPPLDGGHVAGELMPRKQRAAYDSYAKFGPFVVMAVAMIPQISRIFTIPAQFCAEHVYKLVGHLF